MFKKFRSYAALGSVALLVACGGGGGGGSAGSNGPVASSLTFDVASGLRQTNVAGQSATFSVTASNGCVGSGSLTAGPANTSTTFEGQSAFSAVSMLNINYTNCTPGVISSTTTAYVNINYLPLGASGDKYLVYTGTLNVPSAVKVGDVGVVGAGIRYTNSSKNTQDGTVQLSYLMEADTASTALLTVATKVYTNTNALETTQLTKYRITSANSLSLVTLTIQYSNGTSVVFTRT